MRIKLENRFGLSKEQINIPFIVNDVPMGVVTDVTHEDVFVLLWDRFITVDQTPNFDNPNDKKITAIHIKHKMSSMDMLNSIDIVD